MNAERWKKIEEIFQEALDIPPTERAGFIENKSGDDEELRREIKKLIARYESDEDFLESPVWTDSKVLGNTLKNRVASSIEEEIASSSNTDTFEKHRIGVYQLTGQIGKGGMGTVYKAERADGEFQQNVAIKLIKRGMDTDFIIKRFRQERQILANLNHPNIARLLDGGTTSDGLSYFVMELVEGVPVTHFCRQNNFDVRQKLEIFLQICRAIIYAHKRGIVHRDIKPSNILITDEDGTPKLLDFGIAKILDPDSTHESVSPTATQMRLMTPEYASPEQARGEEIMPSSDQYSLGVLLYELLTGTRPYKFSSRAPHEIARVICEEEVRSPKFEDQNSVNNLLTEILLKSLQKNPLQRFESVEDFAGKIEKFLRGEKITIENLVKETDVGEFSVKTGANREQTEIGENNPNINFFKTNLSNKSVSPRWKGVKQGIFISILSVILIPVFLVMTVTAVIPPPLVTIIFLLSFFGGIIRIIYALMFEAKRAEFSDFSEAANVETGESNSKNAFSTNENLEFADSSERVISKEMPADEKTIAVLPFKNLNMIARETTDSGEFLTVGLADALITRLSNVKKLVVRPTGSILKFGGENIDEFAAGSELNVEFLLVGSVLRVDKKIRISVQLLDAGKYKTIWAERFNEDFTDFLDIEDSISAKVAELLVPHLTGEDREKLAKRGTDQPKAYEAYLRGRFYWNTFTEDSFAKAFVSYQEAIAHDEEYALAFAGIADYYIWLGVYGVLPPKECYPLAQNAARRAVELDDELAEGYAALGFAQLCGEFNWIEAEKNAIRAIEINPHYAVARLWYSYILQTDGRFEEGIAQARKAVQLDPLTYTSHHVLAWSFYFARRFDEAAEQIARTIEKFPVIGLGYFTQSWFLRFLGEHEKALDASNKALELSGGSFFVRLGHAQALAAAGKKSDTEEILQEIFKLTKLQYLSFYQVALVHIYAGANEKALDALERAYEDREGWLIWLRSEPAFDSIRDNERYQKLLADTNQKFV